MYEPGLSCDDGAQGTLCPYLNSKEKELVLWPGDVV
jgi:hypothetical protein